MEYQRKSRILLYGEPEAYQACFDYLGDQGHTMVVAKTITEAKKQVYGELADILILDLPTLGDVGLALCRRLKNDPLTYNKPIIIAASNAHDEMELAAIQAGVDDFAVFPLDIQVLSARIHMIVSRSNRLQMSNPLTGLPGNLAVEEHINLRLQQNEPIAVAYVDLDNFKIFNDKYGYTRGDNVIRLTAMVIKEAIQNYGRRDDFFGHIGGDDFIMVTDWACLDSVCDHVIKSFDTLVPFQYDEEDRKRGIVLAISRQGEPLSFPLMTVSIGVVTNRKRELKNCLQIADLATEMKCYAKQFRESIYVVDRRNDNDTYDSSAPDDPEDSLSPKDTSQEEAPSQVGD